jgi:FkbM family methyltransferase
MILRTKTKIALARAVQRLVMAVRRAFGRGPVAVFDRGGLRWKLDLREGVDFSIFLLGSFEPEVISAYRRMVQPGATVIDVGANIGAHTLSLASCVGPTGRVVAVEPTQYAFERLREHISLNPELAPRITARQAMLMGSPSAALAEHIESSWPLEVPATAHHEHAGVAKATTGASVATLDDLTAELALAKVDFIKLDVDGYEVEVLRGSRRVLSDFRPTVFFEYAPYVIDEKGYDAHEMIRILREFGYRFTDLKGRIFAGAHGLPEVPVGAGVNLVAIPSRES